MKRAGTIALVLMGGGLVVWDLMPSVFVSGETQECADARRADAPAAQPGSPEAQRLADCQAEASGHGSGRSWFHGGSGGSHVSSGAVAGAAAGVVAAGVARGGFGASGIAHASGGG